MYNLGNGYPHIITDADVTPEETTFGQYSGEY